MKAKVITKIPGPKSTKVLQKLKVLNGGYGGVYPFVHAHAGQGVYFKDIDGNTFLDFASQVATNPLGYNHPAIKEVIKQYARQSPVKYAGQDFATKEHVQLLEELMSITPKHLNAAFLVNSGAEAIENTLKSCMRARPTAKYGVSFTSAFHGRTLGALSMTNSKVIHKKDYFSIPTKRLPFSDEAPAEFQRLLDEEVAPHEICFVILEHIQGEGGYNVASKKMVKEIRRLCRRYNIPFIADEVQSGMGRTGNWWAWEHFESKPDFMAAAKALQVGATIASKKYFPKEEGSLSSTWGGGHCIDLASGIATIKTIKKQRLLTHNKTMGKYIEKHFKELHKDTGHAWNTRGLGLMRAFDLPTTKMRDDVVTECTRNGLVLLGCGQKGIRLIPPFVVQREHIDEAFTIIKTVMRKCCKPRFRHT